MQAVKLARGQIRELQSHLSETPLENYELLWVLESCLDTPAGAVFGLGTEPWSAGLMIIQRQCIWLRLENEILLESLLAELPEWDLYRFYTASANTADMLSRWFPRGQLSQSWLWVRNLTKTWRKRFPVSVQVNPDPDASGGRIFAVSDQDGRAIAFCTSQQVVAPWQEVIQWSLQAEKDLVYWTEQAFGAVTAALLEDGSPVVVRVEDEELTGVLEPLGYREFSQLFYYVAARE
jgi:hypothetical protein